MVIALAALLANASSVPTPIHVGQLRTTYTFRDSDSLFCSPWGLTHMWHMHIYINKNKSLK